MKYKKASLLVLLTILVSTFQMGAMHQLGRIATKKIFTKNFAKRAFSKTMTGLNWYISTGQMIAVGIYGGYINELFGNESSIKTTEASNDVKSFVRDTLDDEKVNVKIMNSPLIPAAAISKNILVAKSTFIPSLENAVEGHGLEKDKKMWEFILHHEHNHQKAKDLHRICIAMCTIPFGTHYAARLIGRKIVPYATKAFTKTWNKPKSTHGIRWFFKELSNIPAGLAKYSTSMLSFTAYKRHREQKADDNVPEDIDILKGGTRFFKIFIKHEPKLNYNPSFLKNILELVIRLCSSHPPTEHRLKKIEDRIKNIEKKEQHRS